MHERSEKQSRFSATQRHSRRNRLLFGALALLALALLSGFWWSGRDGRTTVQAQDGQVALPAAQFADGIARHYRYLSDSIAIHFFVVKSSDGTVRAAFDTCDTCYAARKGYRQEGEFMICSNCEQKFHTSRINEVSGGCNPVPLTRSMVADRLLITTADLDRGARYFR